MDAVPVTRSRLWKSKADFFRPFRAAAAVEAGENITPLYDPLVPRTEVDEPDLRDLNASLAALVDVFPHIEPEVFRDMLTSVSEESRIQLVTEHLLSKKTNWVRGRVRTPRACDDRKWPLSRSRGAGAAVVDGLSEEQCFRSEGYKLAVKQVFYQEFRSLSHSSIRAVLAEQNFSYTLSRPILQQLSAKSWRFSFASIWPKRSPATSAGDHPFIIWQPNINHGNRLSPAIKRTGSAQLDQELYQLFVEPVLDQQKQALLAADHSIAVKLNETEAEAAGALFDCQCCYGSVTFEMICTCDDGCHQLCFDCVQRTANEALYGQGWARTVDMAKSTLRCFATATQECSGSIQPSMLQRILAQDASKENLWIKFEDRVASEALLKSLLPVQRCPFCNYVEVDLVPSPKRRNATGIWHHLTLRSSTSFQTAHSIFVTATLVFTLPLLALASVIWLFIRTFPPAMVIISASWSRVFRSRCGLKFHCRHPECRRTSCIRCKEPWRDPHECFESQRTSLRTAIESSATAAIKRTCPRCLLSFVKSSGCNKLVCNCGYTMCYVCRQEITSKEGYSHFCQHFRPNGGRCSECDRCDLYGSEDEEAAIRRAVEEAERLWSEKEGVKTDDDPVTRAMVDALVDPTGGQRYWEGWLDAFVDMMIA